MHDHHVPGTIIPFLYIDPGEKCKDTKKLWDHSQINVFLHPSAGFLRPHYSLSRGPCYSLTCLSVAYWKTVLACGVIPYPRPAVLPVSPPSLSRPNHQTGEHPPCPPLSSHIIRHKILPSAFNFFAPHPSYSFSFVQTSNMGDQLFPDLPAFFFFSEWSVYGKRGHL